MLCPSCDEPLTQEDLEGQEIDRCYSCGGMWLDESELGHAVRQIPTPVVTGEEQASGPTGITCPRCASAMKLSNYAHDSGVLIDRCESCNGVWLAVGQLDLIAQYRIGTPAVRSLACAAGAEIRSSNRLDRLRRTLRSRVLSGTIVFLYLVTTVVAGNVEMALRFAGFLALPLVCIWFPDGMGRRAGVGLGLAQPAITQETPGDCVAIAGWLLLVCPLVAVAIASLR